MYHYRQIRLVADNAEALAGLNRAALLYRDLPMPLYRRSDLRPPWL